MLCGSAFAAGFSDVPEGAAYGDAVAYLNEIGIMKGHTDGLFHPSDNVTRAQMAVICCRVMGVESDAEANAQQIFYDVPSSYWAVGYINKTAELGIVSGFEDKSFKPDDPVTYEQALTMVVCAWGWGELAYESGGWPDGYIKVANDSGYTEGITHNAKDPTSRGIVAQLVYNSMKE